MTTIFEDGDNTNPPSPSLELLETPLKNDLVDSKSEVPEEDGSSGTRARTSTASSLDGNGTFASFTTDDPDEISNQVRVVHVQVADGSSQQNSVTVPTQVNSNSQGTLYTMNSSGQIQQVIAASESTSGGGLTAVTVDTNAQDASRYSYYPAVQAGDSNQGGSQQFYVMMSPQEVIPVTGNSAPRIIAPRAQSLTQIGDCTFAVETTEEPPTVQFRKVESQATTRSSRDERRRATHNEVERRRRDKINTWIMKLAAVVPDCQMDQSKQGTSKGGVLSKSLDHIIKLRAQNDRMAETIKEQERILVENQVLRQQVEKLRQENALLQSQNIQLRQNAQSMEEESKTIVTEE